MAATEQSQLNRRDERVREIGFARRALRRPELGAAAGCVLVIIFFAIFAGDSGLFSARGIVNFLEVSAQLGILAVAVALLMIGGEFDLSPCHCAATHRGPRRSRRARSRGVAYGRRRGPRTSPSRARHRRAWPPT